MDLEKMQRNVMRYSRLRVGPLEARGVSAIVLSAAGIVLAAGVSRTMERLGPALPETFRELRKLTRARRDERAIEG